MDNSDDLVIHASDESRSCSPADCVGDLLLLEAEGWISDGSASCSTSPASSPEKPDTPRRLLFPPSPGRTCITSEDENEETELIDLESPASQACSVMVSNRLPQTPGKEFAEEIKRDKCRANIHLQLSPSWPCKSLFDHSPVLNSNKPLHFIQPTPVMAALDCTSPISSDEDCWQDGIPGPCPAKEDTKSQFWHRGPRFHPPPSPTFPWSPPSKRMRVAPYL